MIGIRVDANKEIATGHVMRCLSIATGMKNAGIKAVFITADETTKQIVSSHGFEAICLNSQWNNLEGEIERLISAIQEYNINKLLIDNYFVTEQYLKQLATYIKVIYIDDLNSFRYPVSMVINYNIFHRIFPYSKMYRGTGTELLLGCDYAPLREEFRALTPEHRETVRNVLITTGGTDQYNVAAKLLNKITAEKMFKDIAFHVVVGKLNTNLDCLEELSSKENFVVLHKNVQAMSELMLGCEIAITAGGSTMYELCACGAPAICFSFADNQLYGVKGFEKEGLMAYAGDIREDEEKCITNLISYIEQYISNPQARKELAINMREKVDGNGVLRIVDAIMKL